MNARINRLFIAVVVLLLGLPIAAATDETDVALIKAASDGDRDTVQSLILKGANVNAKYVVNDWTALYMASQNGHTEVVKTLLDSGAEVNCKTRDGGWTPVIIASQNGHTEVVKLLLEKGADVQAKATFGKRGIAVVEVRPDGKKQSEPQPIFITAMGQAKKNGHREIIALLEKAGEEEPSDKTPNTRIVPFKDGYCRVETPTLVMAKAGAEFEFGATVKHEGKEFQIQKPISTNPFVVPALTVQILTNSKKPSGPPRKLECTGQKWNNTLNTVDLYFVDDTVQVVVHAYTPAMGGFIVKDVKCSSPKKR